MRNIGSSGTANFVLSFEGGEIRFCKASLIPSFSDDAEGLGEGGVLA
jgi:hypothetical protein